MMDIMRVEGSLICTSRVAGLGLVPLRVLRDAKGGFVVAVDECDARPGDWVFTIAGSAARLACSDRTLQTDLTIGGVIDAWDEDVPAPTQALPIPSATEPRQ